MIWVITCKDNSFEANTGCETVICVDGNDGNDTNDDQLANIWSTFVLTIIVPIQLINATEQDPSIDDPGQDLQIDKAKGKVISDEDVTQIGVTITDDETATGYFRFDDGVNDIVNDSDHFCKSPSELQK